MRTALEALFDAMVTDGWATESGGDVDSFHHFAWFTNTPAELDEIRQAFAETIETYGDPGDEAMTGHFLVITGSTGNITILGYATESGARMAYNEHEQAYGQLRYALGRV